MTNVAASTAIAVPGLEIAISTPAIAGPITSPTCRARPSSAFASLQVLAARDLRNEAAGRRLEARIEHAVERGEGHDVPELGGVGQQQRGERRLHRAAPEVRHDHDVAAVQPVRPHSGGEDQDGERERLRGQHDSELAGRPVEVVEHRERKRDREQRVADDRHGLAGEQQPELRKREDRGEPHRATVASVALTCHAQLTQLGHGGECDSRRDRCGE